MKNLGNFIKSKLPKNTTCGAHLESVLPNLRPLEYCNTCEISFCYTCGNKHIDAYCNVEWGMDVFDSLEVSKNDKNEKFNTGHPFVVDLEKLKCPCGSPFLSKPTSSICSACGTATCSPECHDKYAQKENKCLFIRNFVINEDTNFIQGLRLIKVTDILKAIRLNVPMYTPTSFSNTKFMKALIGPLPFSLILQRGFRQYGQPHDVTLNAMIEYDHSEDKTKLFNEHYSRLCMCDCKVCANRSPHPIYNCYKECEKISDVTEKEKLEYGMYKKCICTCSFCLSKEKFHSIDDCHAGCLAVTGKKRL